MHRNLVNNYTQAIKKPQEGRREGQKALAGGMGAPTTAWVLPWGPALGHGGKTGAGLEGSEWGQAESQRWALGHICKPEEGRGHAGGGITALPK